MDQKKKTKVNKEAADQIRKSMLKASKDLVTITVPLWENLNYKSRSFLEKLLLDGQYGIQTMQKRLEDKIFRIGILSGSSCGKSFLFNALLKIPLLPVADVRTSNTKLQLIYGKHCRIEIRRYGTSEIVYTIDCEQTDREMLRMLKEYAYHCYEVIDLQNIGYFLPDELLSDGLTLKDAERLEINPNEPWHMAFLWMTLLTTYINQNADREELSPKCSCALDARTELYRKLGLDAESDYDIILYMDNPFLASGISLVDLPGVGTVVRSQDQTAADTIRDTDAIIIAVDKSIGGDNVNKALGSLLECAQFRHEGSRENRIIPLLTKVDTIKGKGHKLKQIVETIKDFFVKEILEPNKIELTRDDIHSVSAMNAEYVFCENAGIPYDRCLLVTDEATCDTLEDMKIKYEEESFIPEFSAFLQDFAVQGQVMVSAELFMQCVEYARICVGILKDQLGDGLLTFLEYENGDDLISPDLFESLRGDILKCLENMANVFQKSPMNGVTKSGRISHCVQQIKDIRKDLENRINTEAFATYKNEMQKTKVESMEDAQGRYINLRGDGDFFQTDEKGSVTMEQKKIGIEEKIENADRIMASVIKASENLIEISKPLWEEPEKETLLSDENYGIKAFQERLKNKIFRIGILSNQSCGKSFLFNALLKIPLLPVADVRTSNTKLQLIYGKRWRIEIRRSGASQIVRTIDCERTDREMLRMLKEFVYHCYKVIDLQNIGYFLPDELLSDGLTLKDAEKLEINPNEPWHMAFLWMTLLTTYINQNADRKGVKAEWNRALDARTELYRKLGLDAESDYDITLYMDNPFLAMGISIVDLPGVGATVKGTKKARSQDQTAADTIRDTDAIIIAVDKTIIGGNVDKALGSLLGCAQFRHEGSRENRIIPLVTKVDTIKGKRHKLKQKVENIKDSFIKEILEPNKIELTRDDIHSVSAMNAEYVFCENAGIPYDRCLLVTEEATCATLEDMKIKYEEESFIPEFSAFLQDFAVRGQIMTSAELFAQCIAYAQKSVNILEGKLKANLISLDSFEKVTEEILSNLSNIVEVSFDAATKRIIGIIERNGKKLEKIQDNLSEEINVKVHSVLEKEIQDAKNALIEEAKNLPENMWGDVVLFRVDRKGNTTYEPAYYNCVSMIDDFASTTYSGTMTAILDTMSNALNEIGKVLHQLDTEVIAAYMDLNNEFDTLKEQLDIRCEEKGINQQSQFMISLTKRCKEIVKANADVKNDLAFINSTKDLDDSFRSTSLNVISSFISTMAGIAENIKVECTETGLIRKKTTLIRYSNFLSSLDSEIKVTASADKVCANMMGDIIGLCNNFFTEVQLKKGAPASEPIKAMQTLTRSMKDDLLINKGKGEGEKQGNLRQVWKEYHRFIDKADTVHKEMYAPFNSVRKEGGSLAAFISKHIERRLILTDNLPERVEKALDDN